jgi:hypothetical protein
MATATITGQGVKTVVSSESMSVVAKRVDGPQKPMQRLGTLVSKRRSFLPRRTAL